MGIGYRVIHRVMKGNVGINRDQGTHIDGIVIELGNLASNDGCIGIIVKIPYVATLI